MTKFSRELKAVTFDSSTSNTFHDNEEKLKQTDGGDLPDTVSLFNFQKWHSKNPLIYKPNFNTRYFAHNGHLFHWSSGRRTGAYQGFDHFIVLRCFGRNAKPVKDLLHEIKDFTLTKEIKTTEVYRSSMNAEAGQWLRQSVKPSRPLCTVSLDEQQKAQITIDLNEYLQPSTARWYASRGIPYRRGYLFHGPPGTGKTSLGFALAGIFGLGIYCVSLSEMGLTESHLATLFGNLPQRCIVLLEDVDAAGLRRNNDGLLNPAGCEPPSPTQGPELVSIASIRAAQSKGGRSLISLAGLLNIIDGPAAQEVSMMGPNSIQNSNVC
jgi:chaperone BCS1